MRNRTLLDLLLLVTLFALPSCVPITPAERATYDAIAPDHAIYVQADPNLAPDQKQRRLGLLESWRIRVGAPQGGAK